VASAAHRQIDGGELSSSFGGGAHELAPAAAARAQRSNWVVMGFSLSLL